MYYHPMCLHVFFLQHMPYKQQQLEKKTLLLESLDPITAAAAAALAGFPCPHLAAPRPPSGSVVVVTVAQQCEEPAAGGEGGHRHEHAAGTSVHVHPPHEGPASNTRPTKSWLATRF